MESTRRSMLRKSGKFILLTGAAATAFEYVLAGKAEASPNYEITKHWWAMIIDVDKCIGCGNCVRACSEENDVPEGYFRTWIERYHVEGWDNAHPEVDSPNGGFDGFPDNHKGEKSFFIPKLCNPGGVRLARRFARWVLRLPRPTAWCWWTRSIAWVAAIAFRPVHMAA